MVRALELDEAWQAGALHEAMISLESLPEAMGGSPERARQHFERAVELSHDGSAASVSVSGNRADGRRGRSGGVRDSPREGAGDRSGCERPSTRLATILAQRRARWLLDRTDEYFLEDLGETRGWSGEETEARGSEADGVVPDSGLLVIALWPSLAPPTVWAAPRTLIKMATLAPDGSAWDKALKGMGADWRRLTDGEVTLRIYPGGTAGDEADVVRKMRIGQLDAAGITVVGLTEIDAAFEAFGIPLLFDSYAGS